MPKINQEEYEILKGLNDKWEWVVFESPRIEIYEVKPYRNEDGKWWWRGYSGVTTLHVDLFKFITAADEDPYNIAELIKEYEYSAEHVSHVVNERVKALGNAWKESEGTEVEKNIEWLKEEIWRQDIVIDKGYIYTDDLMSIISEVDDPEVLSQEWIRDNQERKGVHFFVNAIKLQNLLVPKLEKITEERAWEVLSEIYDIPNKRYLREAMRVVADYVGDESTLEELKGRLSEQDEREQLEIAYKDILNRGEFWFDDKKYKVVPKQEHAIEKQAKTVASVIDDFFKSAKRMKEVLDMEVEELEE